MCKIPAVLPGSVLAVTKKQKLDSAVKLTFNEFAGAVITSGLDGLCWKATSFCPPVLGVQTPPGLETFVLAEMNER